MSQALDLYNVAQSAVRAHAALPGSAKTFFSRLDARELRIVRGAVRASQSPAMRAAAVCINHLGNGWLYLAVAVLCPVLAGPGAWRLMLAGSVSAGVSHMFYRVIKPRLARTRPCDFDRALGSPAKALDKYSCPSGHCMTAAAVGIPIAMSFSQFALGIFAVWLLVAWSRLSLAHHYPTDIVLGAALGAGISLAVCAVVP